MKDTQLYEQLLGLSAPWSISGVEVDLERNRITVHVQCDRGVVWGDPETGCDRAHVHGWVQRQYCSGSKEGHPMDSSATIAVTGAERLLAWACLADRREAGVCSQWVCGLARCDREGRTACFDA